MQSSSKVLAQNMADELMSMPLDEAIPLTRACGASRASWDSQALQERGCSTLSGTDVWPCGAGHYLNLTQIAETHHRYSSASRHLLGCVIGERGLANHGRLREVACCSVRTSRVEGAATKTFDEVFGHLIAHGMTPDDLYDAVCKQVSMLVV